MTHSPKARLLKTAWWRSIGGASDWAHSSQSRRTSRTTRLGIGSYPWTCSWAWPRWPWRDRSTRAAWSRSTPGWHQCCSDLGPPPSNKCLQGWSGRRPSEAGHSALVSLENEHFLETIFRSDIFCQISFVMIFHLLEMIFKLLPNGLKTLMSFVVYNIILS